MTITASAFIAGLFYGVLLALGVYTWIVLGDINESLESMNESASNIADELDGIGNGRDSE